MKAQSFSIVVGGSKCNARCPFCVAKMTPDLGIPIECSFNKRRLKKAIHYAQVNGIDTVLLTGNGEPTLYENTITEYLTELKNELPIIELQTNGVKIANGSTPLPLLYRWQELGLDLIALSIVHFDDKKNSGMLGIKDELNLCNLIKKLHDIGFSVRLCCMLIKGFIDSTDKLSDLIKFARECNVEQITLRELGIPANPINTKISQWSSKHKLELDKIVQIHEFIERNGILLLKLAHGTEVYDVSGQNIAMGSCLTRDPNEKELRQIIYFPDGHIRYDWEYNGAIII